MPERVVMKLRRPEDAQRVRPYNIVSDGDLRDAAGRLEDQSEHDDSRDPEQIVSFWSPPDSGWRLDRYNGMPRMARVRTSQTDWAQSAVSS